MTYQQILADLRQKNFKSIYFLHGKESFFIDSIAGYIESHVLNESEKAFNQTVLYGPDIDHLAVVDSARRYPMMAPFQVVIVKEAQGMKDLKELEKYVTKPTPTTILVLCHKHKSLPSNTKLLKLIEEGKGVVFASKPLYDNQVPDWIVEHLRSHKLKVAPQTANLLAEYLGTDLSLIVHELEKFRLHLQPGTEVTTAHVEEFVGISREYNIFELQKALATRNLDKLSRIVKNFIANPKRNPFIVITGSLAGFFTKVYQFHFVKNKPDKDVLEALNLRSSYALRDYRAAAKHYPLAKTESIISTLREYDLKGKGVDFNSVGKEEGELLKELVWKILH